MSARLRNGSVHEATVQLRSTRRRSTQADGGKDTNVQEGVVDCIRMKCEK